MTITTSAPDAKGGVWTHTVRAWKTRVPLSRPDAPGNVYAPLSASATTPYGPIGGSCVPNYRSLDNSWSYTWLGVWFLAIDFYTQDSFDCVGNVTNQYVDAQCTPYSGSSCNGTTQGVNHNISCDHTGVYGICNRDWANVNTYNKLWGDTRTQYMRTEVDQYGSYVFFNNVG